ncbi:ATP-binding protein [Paenibacillus protaetiae]|uniref:ATP-binding protein n=1 Tax=Paenibacillus protaetiae TaxID=2509456 RepID=A0A4P6EXX4_9BACL|nr:ATP-binding protein [Paenibacillus protaetiae]QAY67922.1 ATP-binding protein [Paenibacillus protaetiae]
MSRLAVMTVGKTHSGKTTFAESLQAQLPGSVMIDQDNHAAFINKHYRGLRPKEGPNRLKFAITQTIADYAVRETDCHLILSNSNRYRTGRLKLLEHYRKEGFICVLVYFDVPDAVLQERVAATERSGDIFRTAASFNEVLIRQQKETDDVFPPTAEEADHLFTINTPDDVPAVIQSIIGLQSL